VFTFTTGRLRPSHLPAHVYASDPALKSAAVVITIHNAGYQGSFPPTTPNSFCSPGTSSPWTRWSSSITSTSSRVDWSTPTFSHGEQKYAEEIQTPEFGEQLDTVLRARASRLARILNGVDYDKWDPSTDATCRALFS